MVYLIDIKYLLKRLSYNTILVIGGVFDGVIVIVEEFPIWKSSKTEKANYSNSSFSTEPRHARVT